MPCCFLESNYDETLLENGKYPIYLKTVFAVVWAICRIRALDLFVEHRSPALSHLLLSHLSKENNSPELAAQVFEPFANGTTVVVASRFCASEVYTITASSFG